MKISNLKGLFSMVVIIGNGSGNPGSNLGQSSLSANAFGKDMNPSLLLQQWVNSSADWVL